MKHPFNALLAALFACVFMASAQEPDHVNSTGSSIDTAAERASFREALEIPSVWNGQPYIASRLATFGTGGGGTGSAPIRIFVYGDSYSTGFTLPPNVASKGWMSLGILNSSGTITTNTGDFATWINGVTYTHSAGSQCDLSFGSQVGGYVQGNKAYIAFVKGPSYGSFELFYESSLNTGTWVSLGTVSANNATTIGAYQTFDLPTSNTPFFKLRIGNVTGGGLKRIGTGIYCTDGGGGMIMHLGNLSGFSPNQYTVNAAIFDPIWAGLAPDMVLSCFREDDGTQWDVGGAFNNLYLHSKGVQAATDWVLVGMHPSADETGYASVTTKQRQWAERNVESWFNPYPLFRDYTTANSRGMMYDVMHLSPAGTIMRDHALWKNQILGSYPLGAIGGTGPFNPLLRTSSASGTVQANAVYSDRSFGIRPPPGNLGELELWDASHLNDVRYAFRQRASENSLFFKVQNTDVAEISFRYFKPLYGVAFQKTLRTATFNQWHWDHTSICDASAGAITANLGHSSATLDGRIHVFKKIDATANTVTIDPAGSETIDGAATKVLSAQWQYVTIQSHNGNWVIIGGN